MGTVLSINKNLKQLQRQILLTREIASIMRTSIRTVQEQMSNGKFPVPHFPVNGKGRGVYADTLNAYLEEREREAEEALAISKKKRKKEVVT